MYKELTLEMPSDYRSDLDLKQTQKEIDFIKDYFRNNLAQSLNLSRVSAPMMVVANSGINDDLNSFEKPVEFYASGIDKRVEVVQSLAKWKRYALAKYNFNSGEGLYTNMNAIRPDEEITNLHSIYVDQWDWEKVISIENREISYLKDTVNKIYDVLKRTQSEVYKRNSALKQYPLPKDIFFIHSEDLLDMYPDLTAKEREFEICREKGAVFIIGIGAELKNGKPHDSRAADYDDWCTATKNGKHGLNGDIIVWNNTLKCAMELSSMGIRVVKESLIEQLELKEELHKLRFDFHNKLVSGELPPTIGGGIGQSRLCMFLLQKAHIGEVQAGIWCDKTNKILTERNIHLL